MASRLAAVAKKVAEHLAATQDTHPEGVIADQRYGFINAVLKDNVIRYAHDRNRLRQSDKIDKVLTHRLAGPVIMIGVLLALYNFTFTYSALPVEWVEGIFGWIGGVADASLPDGHLKSLIISGIIDGVGGVMGFVPLIMFMFLGISFIEDSGYLARMAFMLDRVFRMFGLHGSSVMAFIVSGGIAGGCAVPGVMAARTLKSPKERLATLLTVPFMNCGAKLPVYALLVAAFFCRKSGPGHAAPDPDLMDRRPVGGQTASVHCDQGGGHPLCHGTAPLSPAHPQRAAHPYLGADLAVYKKGGNRYSGNFHSALGHDDLSRPG